MNPVAYGPHWPCLPPPASLAPMLRSRASPGSDARHWSPDVILGFADYALSFPIYIRLSFSLSLLLRQSLLYDSQFNISIRTRLISTGYEPGAEVNSMPTISICYCLSSAPVPVDRANISLCLSFLLCLVVHWTESTPSSSASPIVQPPPLYL